MRQEEVSIKPIQTRYKGYHFRSRLEARWAVYFDAIGVKWQYEPEGFELPNGKRYLPDFWLEDVKMWAEVKPSWPTDTEIESARMLALGSRFPVLFLDGTPRHVNYWGVDPESLRDCNWNDYFVASYFLHEGRFYECTAEEFGADRPDVFGMTDKSAVEAALSARFEHGECGRT